MPESWRSTLCLHVVPYEQFRLISRCRDTHSAAVPKHNPLLDDEPPLVSSEEAKEAPAAESISENMGTREGEPLKRRLAREMLNRE